MLLEVPDAHIYIWFFQKGQKGEFKYIRKDSVEIVPYDGIMDTGEGMYRKTGNTGAFKHLSEPMQLKHVRFVAEKYGVDLTNIHMKIERDDAMIGSNYFGLANSQYRGLGRIHLLPDAFSSEEELAWTIYHEKAHLEQFQKYGYENVLAERGKFEADVEKLEKSYFEQKGWLVKWNGVII